MKKLMEVYETKTGLRIERHYILFKTTEYKEIGDVAAAFNFLADFFADKLKVDRKETFSQTSFGSAVKFRLILEEPEPKL